MNARTIVIFCFLNVLAGGALFAQVDDASDSEEAVQAQKARVVQKVGTLEENTVHYDLLQVVLVEDSRTIIIKVPRNVELESESIICVRPNERNFDYVNDTGQCKA